MQINLSKKGIHLSSKFLFKIYFNYNNLKVVNEMQKIPGYAAYIHPYLYNVCNE